MSETMDLSAEVRSNPVRLLLIEDDQREADLTGAYLDDTPRVAWNITRVVNVDEAIPLLMTQQFDAILLDLASSGSYGLDMLRQIRLDAGQTPIAVISGIADSELREAALAEGAAEVLEVRDAHSTILSPSILLLVEREKAEQQGRQLKELLEANPDGVLVVSCSGVVRYINRAALDMFDRRREDFVGELLGFSVKDEEATELTLIRKGETRVCEMRVVSIHWDGEPAYLASLRDMTERKLMEDALRASERRLRLSEAHFAAAQRLGAVGSFSEDIVGNTFNCTPQLYEIFGIEPRATDCAGFWRQVVSASDYNRIQAQIRGSMRGEPSKSIEFRFKLNDPHPRIAICEVEAAFDDSKTPIAVLGVVRDVTEERHAEEQLRQSQKMDAIGNLTGGVAHDFNNILGIVLGNLDIARSNPSDYEDLIDEAIRAATRGAELTQSLLAFSRQQPLQPLRIAPDEAVSEAVNLLRRTLGKNIEIVVRRGVALWPIIVDPAQLHTCLLNLATNARDAMSRGGSLTIAMENRHLDQTYAEMNAEVLPGDYVLIEVSDTGCGMSHEVLGRIFEPFFTTKEKGKGTGLGLSMVFGFIKQSGGHVAVYSEPGVGTTFRLYFPRAETKNSFQAARQIVVDPTGKGETVLVVEDNVALRRVAIRLLRSLGYRALEADGPAEALSLLKRENVDLVFSDVVMPGPIDGFTLARQVMGVWPNVKVLLTSGFPATSLHGQPDMDGSIRLLSKPYQKEEFSRVLRELLDAQ